MGVSRSRDDYRLGKPIIHAAISPLSLFLLYGCSALSIIFLLLFFFFFFPFFLSSSSLSFFFPAAPFFRRAVFPLSLSLFISNLSLVSLHAPHVRSLGLVRDCSRWEEGRYLHFLRAKNRSLLHPYGYDFDFEKKSFCREEREREREREIVEAEPRHAGLYPLSSIQSRTSIRL